MVLIVVFYKRKEPVNFAEVIEIIEEFMFILLGEAEASCSFFGVERVSIEECLAFFFNIARLGVAD
jgi:hypothetical protein